MPRYISPGVTLVPSGAKKIYLTPYTKAVSSTWTVPANVNCLTFEIWGGGGGGAPNCCCTCYGGMSGDGGGYAIKTLTVTPGDVYTYCVGMGGPGCQCWWNSNACGCQGCTTYITGTGLSNFCAVGGLGGYWCANSGCNCYYQSVNAAGYGTACGGDLNIGGFPARRGGCCVWYAHCHIEMTGSSPLGGGTHAYVGSAGGCGYWSCAPYGSYPGGGGGSRPMYSSGWCDCCAGCNGGGSDGLIIITL